MYLYQAPVRAERKQVVHNALWATCCSRAACALRQPGAPPLHTMLLLGSSVVAVHAVDPHLPPSPLKPSFNLRPALQVLLVACPPATSLGPPQAGGHREGRSSVVELSRNTGRWHVKCSGFWGYANRYVASWCECSADATRRCCFIHARAHPYDTCPAAYGAHIWGLKAQ